MKKKIVAIALITGLTLATGASANWGNQGRGMYKNGGGCANYQGMNQQLDEATQAKVTQFFKDNQALRKEIIMKQAEKRAITKNAQSDPKVAAQVTGELFDLRNTLKEKAELAGVSNYIGRQMMGGQMHGFGSGKGRGHGNRQ